jgi:hypothetical protein
LSDAGDWEHVEIYNLGPGLRSVPADTVVCIAHKAAYHIICNSTKDVRALNLEFSVWALNVEHACTANSNLSARTFVIVRLPHSILTTDLELRVRTNFVKSGSMAADDSSDLSSLSSLSAAPSEDESEVQLKKEDGILRFFHKLPNKPDDDEDLAPPPPKREPSPPHEYVLADNKDIAVSHFALFPRRAKLWTRRVALGSGGSRTVPELLADLAFPLQFIVMFRDRFREVLPKSLAPLGPQELEREVVDASPGDRAEHLLCAVLGLLLNRKQDVK